MVGWHLCINMAQVFDLISLNEGLVFTHCAHWNTVLFTICLHVHEHYVSLLRFWRLCCFFPGFISTKALASTSQYCTTWCLLIHRVLISLHARVTLTHQPIPPVIRCKSAHSTLFLTLFRIALIWDFVCVTSWVDFLIFFLNIWGQSAAMSIYWLSQWSLLHVLLSTGCNDCNRHVFCTQALMWLLISFYTSIACHCFFYGTTMEYAPVVTAGWN